MPDTAAPGRLQPRTLVRSGGPWRPRRTPSLSARTASRGVVGRLGRWRPRLGLAVLTGRSYGPRRTMVRRLRPRLPGSVLALRQVERHAREIRLVTLVDRRGPVSLARPRPGSVPVPPVPRMQIVATRWQARPAPVASGAPAQRAPRPAPAPPATRPVAGRPETAPTLRVLARALRPTSGFTTPATRSRPRLVMAAPAAKHPAAPPVGMPPPAASPAAPPRVVRAAPEVRPGAPAVDLDDLVDNVLRQIERRAIAQRERLGLV
jgi:hypothetical protein